MFMLSRSESIVAWLVDDLMSVVSGQQATVERLSYSRPTLYSSLLVVLTTCTVFLHGATRVHRIFVHAEAQKAPDDLYGGRLGNGPRPNPPRWGLMLGVVGVLVANYLLIDLFTGFSMMLSIGSLLAVYSLIDPSFRRGR